MILAWGEDAGNRIGTADGGLVALAEEEGSTGGDVDDAMARGFPRRGNVGRLHGHMVGVDLTPHHPLEQGIGVAQPLRVLADDAHGHLGVLAQHLVEPRAVDGQDADLAGSDRVGAAGDVLQDGHLAEEVALVEMGKHVRRTADVLDDLDLPVLDDVHLRTKVTLVEDHIPGGVRFGRVLDWAVPSGRFEDRFHRSLTLIGGEPQDASRSAYDS